MDEIKLYKALGKAIRVFLLTIPFIVIGIVLITKSNSVNEKIIGWVSILFFGLGILVGFFHLFDRRPQITINQVSIWDRTTKQGEIKWEQIKDAYHIDIYGQKFISLVVDDSFSFKHRQYKWAAKISKYAGAQPLNLSLGQLKINETSFLRFIKEMIHADKNIRPGLIKNYLTQGNN